MQTVSDIRIEPTPNRRVESFGRKYVFIDRSKLIETCAAVISGEIDGVPVIPYGCILV